jgi:cytochrome c oxidase subunit 1
MFAALVGGGMSWFMRLELAEPGLQYLTGGAPDMQFYNVLLTAHGFLMVFFVVMPALIGGFGNWFVPLMIGAPDMAFPRMNNISLWLLIAGLALLLISAFVYTHHCHLVFIIQALLLISVSCRCTLLVRRRFWVQSTLS